MEGVDCGCGARRQLCMWCVCVCGACCACSCAAAAAGRACAMYSMAMCAASSRHGSSSGMHVGMVAAKRHVAAAAEASRERGAAQFAAEQGGLASHMLVCV